MDSWKRIDETSLPDKKTFYSKLYLEEITDKDYTHAQKVFEEFKFKNLGDYHDYHYMFKIIRNCLRMCLKPLKTIVLKYMISILLIFCLHLDLHGKLV